MSATRQSLWSAIMDKAMAASKPMVSFIPHTRNIGDRIPSLIAKTCRIKILTFVKLVDVAVYLLSFLHLRLRASKKIILIENFTNDRLPLPESPFKIWSRLL